MLKIAHIINPAVATEPSDLSVAQPVTFKTMLIAKDFAKGSCDVELFAACFPDEYINIPDDFHKTSKLTRSVQDFDQFKIKRKLPLIADILDRLYLTSNAEYFIYTNADIALQPHFYCTVSSLIQAGYDGFVINRRTISNSITALNQLPLMMAQTGEPHPGHDCFVFRRELYPEFILGKACIGAVYVGRILIWNLALFSVNFFEFKDLHATFHIGNEKTWKNTALDDYKQFNHKEALKILDQLTKIRPDALDLFKQLNLLNPHHAFKKYLT